MFVWFFCTNELYIARKSERSWVQLKERPPLSSNTWWYFSINSFARWMASPKCLCVLWDSKEINLHFYRKCSTFSSSTRASLFAHSRSHTFHSNRIVEECWNWKMALEFRLISLNIHQVCVCVPWLTYERRYNEYAYVLLSLSLDMCMWVFAVV